jgi:hypothetical protein
MIFAHTSCPGGNASFPGLSPCSIWDVPLIQPFHQSAASGSRLVVTPVRYRPPMIRWSAPTNPSHRDCNELQDAPSITPCLPAPRSLQCPTLRESSSWEMEISVGPALPLGTPHDISSTEPVLNQGKEAVRALKDITFGSIAGIAGKYIEYPFDTVKVRLQSQPDHLPLQYAGPLDCFKKSLQRDGFLGLYRGISAPLFGAAVETSSLFFSVRAHRTKPSSKFHID